jgi:hypothetical protein
MTFRSLRTQIQKMPDSQLDNDVSIQVGDEFYEASNFEVLSEDTDVLDAGQGVIVARL